MYYHLAVTAILICLPGFSYSPMNFLPFFIGDCTCSTLKHFNMVGCKLYCCDLFAANLLTSLYVIEVEFQIFFTSFPFVDSFQSLLYSLSLKCFFVPGRLMSESVCCLVNCIDKTNNYLEVFLLVCLSSHLMGPFM